jgi:predicted TIM-barrel fold metal-dependent hydrolase
MAKQGFRFIDPEPHLHEPPDLWRERLDEPYRSLVVAMEGGEERRYRALHPTGGSEERLAPDVYLQGMDLEGIDTGVLMPVRTMLLTRHDDLDPECSLAICRAFNDYAYEYTQANPQRLKFWACLPPHDATLAAEEAKRCVEKLGAVGAAMTGGAINGHLLSDKFFTPLWQELNRLDIPLGFHGPPRSTFPRDNLSQRFFGHTGMKASAQALTLFFHVHAEIAEVIFGGVLEQYPQVRVFFAEASCGWIPWLLYRMDITWNDYQEQVTQHGQDMEIPLPIRPSEYFRRQCFAEVRPDEDVAKYAVDYIGADNLLFSTDFPKEDSRFPEASNMFLALEGFTNEDRRKILWDNPARMFNITG